MYSTRIYLEVKRSEIGYLKFLIEPWDNLAYFTVIDKYRAVVQLVCFIQDLEQVLKVLTGIKEEVELKILKIYRE